MGTQNSDLLEIEEKNGDLQVRSRERQGEESGTGVRE